MSNPYTKDQTVILFRSNPKAEEGRREIMELFSVKIIGFTESKSPLNGAAVGTGVIARSLDGVCTYTCNAEYFPIESSDPYLLWDVVGSTLGGVSTGGWHPVDAWRAVQAGYRYYMPKGNILTLESIISWMTRDQKNYAAA